MTGLAILVPVLDRPHRVEPLLESVARATPDAHVTFVCDRDDEAQITAVEPFAVNEPPIVTTTLLIEDGSYARKIDVALAHGRESLVFLGADDLEFRPGWFEVASACLKDGVEAVGVNDLLDRPREHATHFLMTRRYAEKPTIDGTPGPLFQGYSHWFCDDELIATAKRRGVYAYCEDAVVEHLHPMAGTAPDDATYERGRANRWRDAQLFKRRRRLWR